MKVLVFSFFKTDVLYRLRELVPNTASDILSGDISPARRQEVIDEPIMALIHKKEVEFDKYAKDSLVADAFVASEKMTEKEVQSKIIEIERNRISARKKNIA